MKIVRFGERYAIRKFTITGFMYWDLNSREFWWHTSSCYFPHCLGSSSKVKNRLIENFKTESFTVKEFINEN